MRKFGLIGYPLGHSFSKKYFTEKFIRENISDCQYENYPLTSIDLLDELISNNSDIYGLNVTIPYKSAVIKYLDFIDEQAKSIGAVNVLKLKRNGDEVVSKGFNTDIDGFRNSIFPYLGEEFLMRWFLEQEEVQKLYVMFLKSSALKLLRWT